jgi:TM2 domain-containing membrane protein YozV
MEQRNCSQCGAPLDPKAQTCRYCGEAAPIAVPVAAAPVVQPRPAPVQYAPPAQPPYQQTYPPTPPAYPPQQYAQPYAQPQYAQPPAYPQQPQYVQQYAPPVSNKSKTTAGILAIFLGGIGVHKFYLNRPGMGILYLLFCWTYVPAIIGFIEGIIYLTASDQKFYEKYVRK